MDGLSSLFSSIGGFLTGGGNAATGATPTWTKLLTGGLLGAGELGNILQGQKQSSEQDFMAKLAKNPALLSQMILKAQQPISGALTQDINNRVQGDMAARGLSQAPGIFAGTEAQALAPFEQQNYNAAQQQVMQQLGLYGQSVQGNPTNLSPAMQSFMRTFGFNTGTGGQGQYVPPQNQVQPGITPYQPGGYGENPVPQDSLPIGIMNPGNWGN